MMSASIVNGQRPRMGILCALLSIGSGQVIAAQTTSDSLHACDLASNADVEKITGRHSKDPPGRLTTTRHNESACDFWEAKIQVALFSGQMSQRFIDRILDANGFARTKHVAGGVGDSAFIYFTQPGKDAEGLLFAYAGGRVVTVRMKADQGQPAESTQRAAGGLAKSALAKLR